MSARSVVVLMPFGGKDEIERRRAILNFKRIEYLLRSKCSGKVTTGPEREPVVYAVEVARTVTKEIHRNVLQQIENADIVIALFVEPNPTVSYEVAYRRAYDRPAVLVVDSDENLPLYETDVAYQNWRQDNVLERINKIAKDELPKLPDFTVGIPGDLKDAIDMYDSGLQEGLVKALQEIESTFMPAQITAVQHLCGIVSSETSNFYPCSIVEVPFSGRNEFANNTSPAAVTHFDTRFCQLYGYVDKRGAEVDKPLTLDKLLKKIEKYSNKSGWDEFMKEQLYLAEKVIKTYGFARAKVPLRFNENHPQREYRGTAFLPCIVAQVIDGSLDGPHKMYLLVVYIELPDTLRPDRSTT